MEYGCWFPLAAIRQKPKKKLRFIEGKIEGIYAILMINLTEEQRAIERRAGVFYEDRKREFGNAIAVPQ